MKKIIKGFLVVVFLLSIASCNKNVEKHEVYEVIFRNHLDVVVKSEKVLEGNDAIAPILNIREGYTFKGWDQDFSNVKNHLDVKPLYEVNMYKITIDGILHQIKYLENLPFEDYEAMYENFIGFKDNKNNTYDDKEYKVKSDLILSVVLDDLEYEEVYYQVTLSLNGGSIEGNTSFLVLENSEVNLNDPVKEGYEFIGWYLDSEFLNPFVNNLVMSNLELYAKYELKFEPEIPKGINVGTYKESVYLEFSDVKKNGVKIEYKLTSNNKWINLDHELIRFNNNKIRADIVGLKEGYYNIKVTKSNGNISEINNIYVEPLDRSGYAHFNYNLGIGAYNDDGTLKSDAIVVYVTEENKNDILIDGISEKGLGWILNNAQYSSNTSTTNNQTKYNNSLAKFNKPIVFRIIGKVTAPIGVTGYNSNINGGSKGDNGNMVRIKDANNITIEGIGNDAMIYGWGIHFMASTVGRGKGFEVRNLIFKDYPEDAIGLEGVQEGGVLTKPVERGWIHNVTFYPGYSENPAESDKKFGDGSLDVKRGMYFTIAYNQFLGTHKSNLVGASDSNLQYHFTYHHNLWQNVQSRIPLSRQANIHMYNNVFESTDNNENELSYAQNTRANAYIFSEGNYFNGVKRPSRVDSGAIKSYNDIKYSTYDLDQATLVTTREEKVLSGNKFENFDTNKNIFYYDEVNKRSDVSLLTSPEQARVDVYNLSGSFNEHRNVYKMTDFKINKIEPTLINKDVSEVPNIKIIKETQYLVFEVKTNALVKINDGGAKVPLVLVNQYGKTIIYGSGEKEVEPGIYIIESSISRGTSKGTSQAKDSFIYSYEILVDLADLSEIKVNEAKNAIDMIDSNIVYDNETKDIILNAIDKYNILNDEEKLLVNGEKIESSYNKYINLGVIKIENLIKNIGSVNENSFDKINVARLFYNDALNEIKDLISNYNTLLNAEETFSKYYVLTINNKISEVLDIHNVMLDDYSLLDLINNEYLIILDLYNELNSEDKILVINIEKVLLGIEYFNEINIVYELKGFISEIDLENININEYLDITNNYNFYLGLSDHLKTIINEEEVAKLNEAYIIVENNKDSYIINSHSYIGGNMEDRNNYFTTEKGSSEASGGDVTTNMDFIYKDLNLSASTKYRVLKLESKTTIKFNSINNNGILNIVVLNQGIIRITSPSGTVKEYDLSLYENQISLFSIELLEQGEYVVGRKSGEVRLFSIETIEYI